MNKSNIADLINQLTDDQKTALSTIILNYIRTNKILADSSPIECPYCHQNQHFIKKGFHRGKQRYQCKDCDSKFTCNNNSITYHSHSSQDLWNIVILDTIAGVPIRTTAATINRHPSTVFNMRHKFLLLLEELLPNTALSEIVELDETYVLESEKGNRLVKLRRPARRRGSKSSLRGLSNDQVCICVGTDRFQHVAAKSVNTSKPTSENILEVYEPVIKEGSLVCCDKLASYNKLIELKKCSSERMSSYTEYHSVFHLNTVNGLHSLFKDIYAEMRGCKQIYQ